MAVILKRKKLFNPSRLRSKRRNSARKLSPKQIKFFGTARQRAALKNRGKRKRNSGLKRHLSTKRRRNIGEIITLDIGPTKNPSKRKKGMVRRKRSYANPRRRVARRRRATRNSGIRRTRRARVYANPRRRRRTRNTGVVRRRRRSVYANPNRRDTRRRHRGRRNTNSGRRRRPNTGRRYSMRRRRNSGIRRRNPAIISNLSKAAGIIAGVALTNFALKQVGSFAPMLTTGMTSYATGIVLALAEGYLIGKLFKKPNLGEDIAIGGIVLVLIQAINQNFPSFSIGLSGFGNRGMGLIGNSSFVWPSVLAGPGKFGTFQVAPDYRNYTNAQISANNASMAGSKGMGAIYLQPNGGGRMALRRGVRLN